MGKIIIIGFMGSGKSSVGKELAKQMKLDFFDTDEMISKKEKKTISEIFEQKGEDYFRRVEKDVLNSLAQKQKGVISSGGGIVETFSTQDIKSFGTVIFLHATQEDIIERISNSDRPLIKDKNIEEVVQNLLNKRQILYENAADIIIQTTNKKVKDICSEILELM